MPEAGGKEGMQLFLSVSNNPSSPDLIDCLSRHAVLLEPIKYQIGTPQAFDMQRSMCRASQQSIRQGRGKPLMRGVGAIGIPDQGGLSKTGAFVI